jgi:tetratricopeptide (TPR) repeat protein
VNGINSDKKRMKKTVEVIVGSIALLLVSCGGTGKPDPGETSRMYGARAAINFTNGNLLGALAEYRKAYGAAARMDLPVEQAQCLFNAGRVYYELGLLDSAESAFSTAHRDFLYYHDSGRAARAAGFISIVNAQAGRYDSAYAWYGRGRPKDLRGSEETAFWLTVQARLCLMKDRVPEAMGYLDRAMECYKDEKMWSGMAQVDYDRAGISYTAGRHDEARGLLASSLAFFDKSGERYRRWRVLLASAAVSFCLRDEEAGVRFYTRAADCIPKGITPLPLMESVRTCPAKWWEHYR